MNEYFNIINIYLGIFQVAFNRFPSVFATLVPFVLEDFKAELDGGVGRATRGKKL